MSDSTRKLPRGHTTELVRTTGLTRMTIWRALNNIQCSPDSAIAIHRATDGAIPCWELRPDLWSVGQLPPSLALALARLPEAS